MASSNLGGRKTPSIAGSRASVYSHGSTVRTVRTGVGVGKGSSRHSSKPAWYRRPILRHVFYTDLQRGAWHIGFYSLVSKVRYQVTTAHLDIMDEWHISVSESVDLVHLWLRSLLPP